MAYSFSGTIIRAVASWLDGSGNPKFVSAADPLPVAIAAGGADADVNIAAIAGTAPVTAGVNGLLAAGGNVAASVADAGNPLKVGGRYNATPPTLTDGQRGDLTVDTRSNLKVSLIGANSTTGASLGSPTDTQANGVNTLFVQNFSQLFDGTDWGRARTPDSTIGNAYVENGPYTAGRVTADGQIKGSAGFIHTVTISPTGTVTAGVLTIYNSTTETGTVIASFALPVTTFTPFSVILDVACNTGIYVGFDATLANVGCTVSYR